MSSNVCGTGVWSGPLPGDPDTTNTLLTATPAFGGIDVSWTAAVTNPHAVAHTYLYRSIANSDFLSAVRIATVGGTHFYDKLEELFTYYYWIQVVSINGTVGPVIGPASAVPRLSIDETIIALTGRIDNGMLAQSLKTDIAKITLTAQDLDQEILDRVADTEYLGSQLTLLDDGVNASFGLVLNEINTLADNHNALAQSYSYLASSVGDSSAAIEENNRAMIGYCLVGGVTSSENTPAECSAVGGTWVVAAPLAESVKTVQITDDEGSTASVQQLMQSYKDGLDDLGALYTAKVQVNGLIGGFGVYNDGTEVQAGFDVDTFWVGRTGPDKKKPFIIDSVTGETYIDKAVIPTLTADMIDTKGLSIKDMSGNVILSSGTALDWSRIGGSLKAANNATVGATFGDYNGAGRNISGTITPGNVTTYIANAAIGNAQIGGDIYSSTWYWDSGNPNGWLLQRDGNLFCGNAYIRGNVEASSLKANTLMVNRANIVNAAVDTLQIEGNAVTVPVHSRPGPFNGRAAEWTTIATAWINAGGSVVSIFASASARTITPENPQNIYLRVLSPSGTQIGSNSVSVRDALYSTASLITSSAEAGTYSLQIYKPGFTSFLWAEDISLFLIGTKR